MAKNNYTITHSDGSQSTYYGCSTVAEACEVGEVAVPSGIASNASVTIGEIQDVNSYNVALTEELVVNYSENSQLVAYQDLVKFQGLYKQLEFQETSKLGVMEITSQDENTTFTALGRKYQNQQNGLLLKTNKNQNQLLINTDKLSQDRPIIKVHLEHGVLNNLGYHSGLVGGNNVYFTSPIKGYEIVLQDFIGECESSSVKLRSMKVVDTTSDIEVSSSSYIESTDATRFFLSDPIQKCLIVDSGDVSVCARINMSNVEARYAQYSNFTSDISQTLSLVLLYPKTVEAMYSDRLLSTIELELEYTSADGILMYSDLTIEVWFDAPNPLTHPQLKFDKDFTTEDDTTHETITVDVEKSILYTTSDNKELFNYTDEWAYKFGNNTDVVSHGYGLTSDGTYIGWITYSQVPTDIGTITEYRGLFNKNHEVLTSVSIPEGVEIIGDYAFVSCKKLTTCTFPSTIRVIGAHAFRDSGLVELILPTPAEFQWYNIVVINGSGFKDCHQLQRVEGQLVGLVGGGSHFENCSVLTTMNLQALFFGGRSKYNGVWGAFQANYYSLLSRDSYQTGACAFKDCTSLTTDVCKLLKLVPDAPVHNNEVPMIPDDFCRNCTSMNSITLALDTNHWSTSELDMDGLLPQTIRSIDSFKHVSNAHTLYLQGNYDIVSGFGASTFYGCSGITKLYCNSQHPPYLGIQNISPRYAIDFKKCHLYIPLGRTVAYTSKAQWGDFTRSNIHEITQEEFELALQAL